MKTHRLFLTVFMLAWNCSFGEIKNGYGPEIVAIRQSLKGLTKLLTEDTHLSLFQKTEIKNKIVNLIEYITYFELTEELLLQFRTIAPDLYNEIDTIKNCTRHNVTVYVRFVPEKEMQLGAAGTTNLAHHENDKNVYQSSYGSYTVSVKIASLKKSLLLLAHEFGHIKYQVPNLARYVDFYAAYYQNSTFDSNYIGHNTDDLSGRKAMEYENIFRAQYLNFVKTAAVKVENPSALLQEIRKALGKERNVM